jgi:hypothetical protein
MQDVGNYGVSTEFVCVNPNCHTSIEHKELAVMKSKVIKRENLVRDSLYNTSREVIRDEFDVRYGRGQLCAMVSAIMAMSKTRTFEEAVAIVAPLLPKELDWDCVPDSWQAEFRAHLEVVND